MFLNSAKYLTQQIIVRWQLYSTYKEGKQTFVFLEGMSYLQNVSVITMRNNV